MLDATKDAAHGHCHLPVVQLLVLALCQLKPPGPAKEYLERRLSVPGCPTSSAVPVQSAGILDCLHLNCRVAQSLRCTQYQAGAGMLWLVWDTDPSFYCLLLHLAATGSEMETGNWVWTGARNMARVLDSYRFSRLAFLPSGPVIESCSAVAILAEFILDRLRC